LPVYFWQGLKSFGEWLSKDQANYARFVEVSTKTGLLLSVPLIFEFFLTPQLGTTTDGPGVGLFVLFVLGIGIGGYTAAVDKYPSSKSHQLEILANYKWAGLSLYVVVRHLLHSVGMAIYFVIALPWMATTLSVGLSGIYIVMPAIAFSKRFYSLARRSGHWLCFAVTLTMTAISWLAFSDGFADPRVLWSVAAGTGILSGVSTELIRRSMLIFFARSRLGRMAIRRTTGEIVMSPRDSEMTKVFNGSYIGFVFGVGTTPVRKGTVGKFLRALCIDLPAGKYRKFAQ